MTSARRQNTGLHPVQPADAVGAPSDIQPDAAPAERRVLLVDDDASVRRFTRRALQSLGHIVCEAENGSQALRAVGLFEPDVVLLDLCMPEMDGLEILRLFRSSGCLPHVIAMSGGGMGTVASNLQIASHLGAAATLAKPFSVDELDAVISNAPIAPRRTQ